MVFESLLTYSRSRLQRGWMAQAYSEQVFRHFLTLERKRAEHSNRSFLLVLVSLKRRPEASARISPAVAAALFSSLARCVREVDFIGWYREGRIAGAVLVEGVDSPKESSRRIADRVTHILCSRLPPHHGERVQVRLIESRRLARS